MQLSSKKISRYVFLIGLPLLLIYLAYRVRRILIPFALAVLIAYLLNPLVNLLQKKKVPREIAILAVYLSVFGVIAGAVTIGVPIIMDELNSFGKAVPRLTSEVQGIIYDAQARYSRFAIPEPIKDIFDQKIAHIEEQLISMISSLAQGVVGVFSHFFSLLIAPVFAFYLLADSGSMKRGLMEILPTRWRNDVQALSIDINEIFSKYLRGHLTVCGIVGLLTGIGYAVIGLDYAFLLGIFAGFADLIPYFGPLVGAAPALLLGLLHSKIMALKVIIVVIIIQQLENSVISPKILGDSLGLSPLLVIVALMAGGELYGLWGLLLAVPVTAIMKCVLNYLYLKLVSEN